MIAHAPEGRLIDDWEHSLLWHKVRQFRCTNIRVGRNAELPKGADEFKFENFECPICEQRSEVRAAP
jgi:hypothetical protein